MEDEDFEFESDNDLSDVQFDPEILRTKTPHVKIVHDWAERQCVEMGQTSASEIVSFVREDLDERSLTLELWGVMLQIYLPEDANSNFFVVSEADDVKIQDVLVELNDLPDVRSLEEFLSRASLRLEYQFSRSAECLVLERKQASIASSSTSHEDLQDTQAPALERTQSAVVLSLNAVLSLQEEIIQRLSIEIGIDHDSAAILLLAHGWDDGDLLCKLKSTLWEVAVDGQVRVRSEMNKSSTPLRTCPPGQKIRGIRKGDWLELVDEKGFMLIESSGAVLLRKVADGGADPLEDALVHARAACPRNKRAGASTLCCVCFTDAPIACLGCGHGLCQDCWPAFLSCNLESGTVGGENCLRLRCPGERCPLLVPPHFFRRFLAPDSFARYRRLQALSFVNDNRRVVCCPADGCEFCVAFSRRRSTVRCNCGHVFCFSCRQEAHAPAACSHAKEWVSKLKKSAETLQQQKENIKGCKLCPNPKCGVLSTKMSGCNYLTCSVCKESWCWHCGMWGGGPSGLPPPHHVFDCNLPPDEQWTKQTSDYKFDNEGRYWFYHERYVNHVDSHKFAENLRSTIASMIADLVDDAGVKYKLRDRQLLYDAAELLIECRNVLAWTYVWAFFEEDDVRRHLFEFAQKNLETFTEELSAKIEDRPIDLVLKESDKLLDLTLTLRGYLESIKQYEVIEPPKAPAGGQLEAAKVDLAGKPLGRKKKMHAGSRALASINVKSSTSGTAKRW